MAFLGAFVLTHLNLIGVGQHTVMVVLLGGGAIVLARERAVTWLVAGLGLRALEIANGLDRSAVDDRVAHLRSRMGESVGALPVFTFSVGIADLPAGGDPERRCGRPIEACTAPKPASIRR
jgi:hypothetical protein